MIDLDQLSEYVKNLTGETLSTHELTVILEHLRDDGQIPLAARLDSFFGVTDVRVQALVAFLWKRKASEKVPVPSTTEAPKDEVVPWQLLDDPGLGLDTGSHQPE